MEMLWDLEDQLFLSLDQQHNNYFTVTDKEMTRFMIKLEDAVVLVLFAFKDMIGGETYVKKIPQ